MTSKVVRRGAAATVAALALASTVAGSASAVTATQGRVLLVGTYHGIRGQY